MVEPMGQQQQASSSVRSDPIAYSEGFQNQDYERVLSSLNDDPSQATLSFGDNHTTLLHAACYDGRADIAKVLIDLGADINLRESCGRTPLHHAANHGHLDVIELLVQSGANINAKDEQEMTPLMWGEISRSGRKEEIVELLIKLGAKRVK